MTNTLNISKHKYVSFISYKHDDEEIVKWLKKKLESYRLPSKLCNQYDTVPKRLIEMGDIYLDSDSLRSGVIAKNLNVDMAESKYLIVICSKAAHDAPKYINQEIETFLATGHSIDQIIPFIVDDVENPELTCFPSALQKINETNNLIGINIHDAGKKQAFLKLVAYMLNIQVTELESAEERRQKRNKILAVCCSVVLLIAGFFGYDYLVPKYEYFVDYTEVYGIPNGIGEVSKDDIKRMHAHYTIKTQYHRVQELRYENSAGTLIEHHNTEYTDRPTKAVYDYLNDGTLKTVTYQNAREQTILTLSYASKNMIDIQNEEEGISVSLLADTTEVSESSIYSSDDVNASKSSILRYIIEYDEHGYVSEKYYIKEPYNNTPTADASGVWGLHYERDLQGRSVAVHYLGYIGTIDSMDTAVSDSDYKIIENTRGVSGKIYQYDDNNLISVTYVGLDGTTPVLNEKLWASCVVSYDSYHNYISETFIDEDGSLILNSYGYASIEVEYDGRGNWIRLSYYGTDGKPILSSDGYASYENEYDERGNRIRVSYYGTDGKPTLGPKGYASIEMEYDERDNRIRESYYGTDGKPTLGPKGYASKEIEYDERGIEIRNSFYGTDGKPILSSDGCASIEIEWDERGKMIRMSTYGTDGKLIISSIGFAEWKIEYDEQGNKISSIHYDADGNVM